MTADPQRLWPLLKIRERLGRGAHSAPLCRGIPLPQGVCFDRRRLAVVDSQGNILPSAISASARWPDGSIQWCLIRTIVNLAEEEELELYLDSQSTGTEYARSGAPPVVEETAGLVFATAQHVLHIDTKTLGPLNNRSLGITARCSVGYSGIRRDGVIDDHNYRTYLDREGVLFANVELRGHFKLPDARRLEFTCLLTLSADGKRVQGNMQLHNPAAAAHPQGLWDLGDANSVNLDHLTMSLSWRESSPDPLATIGRLHVKADSPVEPFTAHADICQLASGGRHWNSPIHVDHRGKVPMRENGCVLSVDGKEQRADRASPLLQIRCGAGGFLSASIDNFWEQFPAQLTAQDGELSLGLLPNTGYPHELQPGERCTKGFNLYFQSAEDEDWPRFPFPELLATLDPDYVQRCALLELGADAEIDQRLQDLIHAGIAGENNFFNKRETVDEYGWRNFGDLYADHETQGYTGEKLFVSHYNNQYDPLFGFLRQFIFETDARWLQLADDLARHTVDVDIYNTEEDRAEYNHGLFWHTDHYLPAETSSHRAYSRQQSAGAYEGHAHGGGPGGQHCYTTGLLYHFLLTGEKSSRDALYSLRNWIENVYEGAGTLTDVVLAVKNRKRGDLKNHLTGQYPLDRGIANYLHALLDCYALDRRLSTITQIESIIRQTIHPRDELASRELADVEENWYYVVFLQAVCRYLQLKSSTDSFDKSFIYARDALLHYAHWMIEHEAPYLDNPDILEFPNHTWAAQDLRKANVLFYAAHWSPEGGEHFTDKAKEFVDYVTGVLANEPTRQYTRILALLMQNLWPSAPLAPIDHAIPSIGQYEALRAATRAEQALNLLRMVLRALRRFNPRREALAIRRLLPTRSAARTTT